MRGRSSDLIILIACAYAGAGAALVACWDLGSLGLLAAAPVGGSLATLSAALALHLRGCMSGARDGRTSSRSSRMPSIDRTRDRARTI